jgi:hypothetical protein
LKEGAVNRAHRLEALDGEPGGERHGVLLGDADVEGAVRVVLLEQVQPSAAAHRRVHSHHLLVLARLAHQRVRERLRVRRNAADGFLLLPGGDVEARDAVVLVLRALRVGVAAALLGDDVDQHRAHGTRRLDFLQNSHQVLQVVAVHGADVVQTELLEQRRAAAGDHAARVLVNLRRHLLHRHRHRLGDGLGALAKLSQRLGRLQARERAGQRAHRILVQRVVLRGERHLLVVVQDDDHVGVQVAGVVHRLVRHAAGDGAVADDGDDVVAAALHVPRHGHAEPGGDGRRRVPGAEAVVRRLAPFGERREPVRLAHGGHPVPAAGEHLVRVRLVPDVPDDAVLGLVEHVVQRDGELDDPERRPEVAPGLRDVVDEIRAELLRDLLELVHVHALEVRGDVHRVQQRRRGLGGDGAVPLDLSEAF